MFRPCLALVAKTRSPLLAGTLREALPPFIERGWRIEGAAELQEAWREAGLPSVLEAEPEPRTEPATLGLILGGDGTLLGAARRLGALGTPLLGINLGSLGFLTAHPAPETRAIIQAYFDGTLREDRRSLLRTRLFREERLLVDQVVLNDAVLHKGALSRLMEFQLNIDGVKAALLKADGLIVSTPTGSTAYSLSAGGPILHPSLEAWAISPICPHSLTLRPMVVPAQLQASIILGDAEDAHLTLDGQLEHPVAPGDRMELSRAKETVTLLQNPDLPFFTLLRQKLHWSTR